MAIPSAVTVASLAVVLAAGVGLAAVSAEAVRETASSPSSATTTPTPPTVSAAGRAPTRSASPPTRTAPAQTLHKRSEPRDDPDAVPKVLVEVFNNSGVTGLAAQEAGLLQSAGWSVAATDNWYGVIPASTVYYPPQLADEARQLAAVLGVGRLQPAVAPMQFDRLTVIFTG